MLFTFHDMKELTLLETPYFTLVSDNFSSDYEMEYWSKQKYMKLSINLHQHKKTYEHCDHISNYD